MQILMGQEVEGDTHQVLASVPDLVSFVERQRDMVVDRVASRAHGFILSGLGGLSCRQTLPLPSGSFAYGPLGTTVSISTSRAGGNRGLLWEPKGIARR